MFKFKIVVSAIWQSPFRSRFYEILYGMLHVSLEDCDTVNGLYLQRYSSKVQFKPSSTRSKHGSEL